MIKRALPIALFISLLTGCSSVPAEGETAKVESALAELGKQCGVASDVLKLGSDGLVSFRPSPSEKYERVDCVARGLKKPEFANHVKIGFVSGEAPAQEEQK